VESTLNIVVKNKKIRHGDIVHLLLSYLSAAMKSNRGKNSKALEHFFRERLVKKQDRAALNTALNEITLALKGDKDKRIRRAPSEPKVVPKAQVASTKVEEACNVKSLPEIPCSSDQDRILEIRKGMEFVKQLHDQIHPKV